MINSEKLSSFCYSTADYRDLYFESEIFVSKKKKKKK